MSNKRLRTFNKYVTNRITGAFAHLTRGPFALVYHVGRRSGKTYETTIMVEPLGDRFVIALTYGPNVDWYRNILAAGHCRLFWHRKTYELEQPEPLAVETALAAFPRPQKMILRRLGIQHFVGMKYREVAQTSKTDKALVEG